ncbi:hypothetical protein AAFF_G00262170 [Aldrovandia affinis]|uniref:Uncharacterized protein n=1 Tax=Aldrovandia affinis TaxID=143900 RepID=A0AAD7SSJ8_9TELE|nr:hypothetical protein AAFF_G00262170 [Aldrovandia affinis]
MFALLGNFNRRDRDRRTRWGGRGGEGGGDQTLVSSTGQSASAIYLTTLATPALLLREAGAEALRSALGLNQGPPPPPPPAPPPPLGTRAAPTGPAPSPSSTSCWRTASSAWWRRRRRRTKRQSLGGGGRPAGG